MDKSRNRTDLLAAGRKKLQQFRQKKDTKGSKSSDKAGKSDGSSNTAKLADSLQQVPDEETLQHDVDRAGALSDSHSQNDLRSTDIDVATSDQLSNAEIVGNEPIADVGQRAENLVADGSSVDLNRAEGNDSDLSLPHTDGSAYVSGTQEVLVSEERSIDADNPVDVGLSSYHVANLTEEVADTVEVERVQTEVQESDGVWSKRDADSDISIKGDGRLSPNELSESVGGSETAGITKMDEATQRDPLGGKKDVSADVAVDEMKYQETNAIPVFSGILSGSYGSAAVNSEVLDKQQEGSVSHFSDEEKLQSLSRPGKSVNYLEDKLFNIDNKAVDMEESYEFKPDGSKLSIFRSDTSSISLSQLPEILQRLGEDEFRFLFKSLEYTTRLMSTDGWVMSGAASFDVIDSLKEQLYITSVDKDLTSLQLAEQSELSFSLCDLGAKHEIIAEELVESRSELSRVASQRDNLNEELTAATTEISELSARIDELVKKLEMSQGDISILSSDLENSRSLFAALDVENVNLNRSLNALTKEKECLVEENGHLLLQNENTGKELAECKGLLKSLQLENARLNENLASLSEEKEKLNKEKEYFGSENEKLHTVLENCRSAIETLRVESSNFNSILTSLTEDRKKLVEENEYLACETENLAAELMECKVLKEAFQMEMLNSKEILTSLSEERHMVKEEKDLLIIEIKKLSLELAELHTEYGKAVDDLKEATLHIEQLNGENASIRSSLDLLESDNKELHGHELNRSAKVNGVDNQFEASGAPSTTRDRAPSEQLGVYSYDGCYNVQVMKVHLDEAEKVLGKAIKGSDSASESMSGNKVVALGVSKLIQAFESKGHADDNDPQEQHPTENQTAEETFILTEEQMRKLTALFRELVRDAENAEKFIQRERESKTSADVLVAELKAKYDSLSEHADYLEEVHIKLMVLNDAFEQHISNTKVRQEELVVLCNSLHKQKDNIEEDNSQYRQKLKDLQAIIMGLQFKFEEIYQGSDAMASSIYNQVESLHKEVDDWGLIHQEWNSFVAHVVQSLGKLDSLSFSSFPDSIHSSLDIASRITASIDLSIEQIQSLQAQLESDRQNHEALLNAYKEMDVKFSNLQMNNEMANGILQKVLSNLQNIVNETCGPGEETNSERKGDKLLDPLNPGVFEAILEQLGNVLREELQLEAVNSKLNSELRERADYIDELQKGYVGSDVILKLIGYVQQVFMLEDCNFSIDEPALCVESMIQFIIQKYKETDEQRNLDKDKSGSREMQLIDCQSQMDHLSLLVIQHETENIVLGECLRSALTDILSVHSQLQGKVAELEQSEQRVFSIREKLSIAVTKGKALIAQRDSLKHSVAERSSELEKCLQELQSKDAMILELESKLKSYSEAGERMEALESELSYIRNSATALRESFLLKDSVLQRIEETLEDLDLPEHVHSRDIIEKVDWLARSFSENSLPPADWDQKSLEGGGSFSEVGFPVRDGWKEDKQPNELAGDDLKTRYEDLERKFYVLAEQNEMLEQSLMERNNLVQRWEEVLGRINMPSQFSSMEPEDRLVWLGSALSDAQSHCYSLEEKIDGVETLCESLTADLEESRKKISELETALQSTISEKELLSNNMEILTQDYYKISEKHSQIETINHSLLDEVSSLQEQLDQKVGVEAHIHHVEDGIRRLQELIKDVLEISNTEDLVYGSHGIESLEQLLRNLVEKYQKLTLVDNTYVVTKEAALIDDKKSANDSQDVELQNVAVLSKKLEDAMGELTQMTEERDMYLRNNQSLVHEVEALDMQRKELHDLLNQEEQKSSSFREKLNVAVRKGKSLVQQRDSMKQVIEELNAEVERLKLEIGFHKTAVSNYEEKINVLSANQERIEAVGSENTILKDRLVKIESSLLEKEHTIGMILKGIGDIDVGPEFNNCEPVVKLEKIGRQCRDLHAALASSEQESRKSKVAAELLLAELNEVQERNDNLQDELAKAFENLSELASARDLAEAAKREALEHFDKLSAVSSEERENHLAEIRDFKLSLDQHKEDLSVIDEMLGVVLSKDLEILHNFKSSIESCVQQGDAFLLPDVTGGAITCSKALNEVFATEIGSLRDKLSRHYYTLHEEAGHILDAVRTVYKEMTTCKQSCESMKREVMMLQSTAKEKDLALFKIRKKFSMLHGACDRVMMDIKDCKTQLLRGVIAPPESITLKSQASEEETVNVVELNDMFSEDATENMRERLLSVVSDFIGMQGEVVEVSQREMKTAISDLQKELQDKDIQRDRICMELVSQIKNAEAIANNFREELQTANTRLQDLQGQLDLMKEERSVMEQRVKDIQDQEATSIDLQQRVKSLMNSLAAKEQETEALMQALDEEEAQMEDLTSKIEELERILQQKNQEMENLEASRSKALKKLTVTVKKFDELHQLSESLLSEVEKLQSQVQDRDREVSFLRQEVTRCTNDALVAAQMSSRTNFNEINDFLTWLEKMIPGVQVDEVHLDVVKTKQLNAYKDVLQKQITSIISELEGLRLAVQNSDLMLQAERNRVEELTQKEELLENSLREKEAEISMLRGAGIPGQATNSTSEIMEVESMANKWTVPTTVSPQVRSLRKTNNDQAAIAIDMDPSIERLEDEDDDKAHGFKSLTTSRVVPRFTRPVTDMVDGLWVSCDRTLMRQPALRLAVIFYWAVLHALLATYVV